MSDAIGEYDEAQERIAELMDEYRDYKTTAELMDQSMQEVKKELTPLLEKYGDWQDDIGYARMVTRDRSVTYSGKEVEKLRIAWLESEDTVLQAAGLMLQMHRSERPGATYAQCK